MKGSSAKMNNTILSLNINSVRSIAKKVNLQQFIKQNNPDILMLQETHLKTGSHFAIQGYVIFNQYRATQNGGGTSQHKHPHKRQHQK